MKILTVRQPFASLIVRGGKDIENRPRKSNYTGPLLIHAGSSPYAGYTSKELETKGYPFGCVVGIVEMTGCVEESSSEWFSGPFGYTFTNRRYFVEPIPCSGKLGIFNIEDAEVIRMIEIQMKKAKPTAK